MPARVERFPLPHRPGWRIFIPLFVWAFVVTLLSIIRRVACEPSLPRMSEQWLRSRQHDFHRDEI